MKTLNVQAIFNSIDGECNGFNGSGDLTTFIRLKGCNLRCEACDTVYSQESEPYNYMTLDQIVNHPSILNKITITGGEPLAQDETKDLISLLIELGHHITVETNGCFNKPCLKPITLQPEAFYRLTNENLRYVFDYKLPSTKMNHFMDKSIFETTSFTDIIKFVIADEHDYNLAKDLVKTNNWLGRKVFSPGFSSDNTDISWPTTLADKMVKDAKELQDVQYSLQIHKILWPNSKEEK